MRGGHGDLPVLILLWTSIVTNLCLFIDILTITKQILDALCGRCLLRVGIL